MIERVAAALYAVDDDVTEAFARERVASWRDEPHQGDCTGIAATCMQCVYQDYTKRARAAIEAMMEPTEAMRHAGLFAWAEACGPIPEGRPGRTDEELARQRLMHAGAVSVSTKQLVPAYQAMLRASLQGDER